MSELSSMHGLRVDVEPLAGRAVQRRESGRAGDAALVALGAARTGAQP